MVASAQGGVAIGRGEQCIHLRLFQVGEFGAVKALERHGANRGAPCNVLRAVFGNEAGHRVDSGQTLVAGTDRAAALTFQGDRESA